MFNGIRPKWVLGLSMIIVTALVLAACSSSDETVTTSSSPGTVQQPDAPAAAQAAAAAAGDTTSPSAPVAAQAPAGAKGSSGAAMAMEPKVGRVIVAFPGPSTEGNDSNFDFSSPPSVHCSRGSAPIAIFLWMRSRRLRLK
mgnify:CR=1 FL=1